MEGIYLFVLHEEPRRIWSEWFYAPFRSVSDSVEWHMQDFSEEYAARYGVVPRLRWGDPHHHSCRLYDAGCYGACLYAFPPVQPEAVVHEVSVDELFERVRAQALRPAFSRC